jgi:hypothetical protein
MEKFFRLKNLYYCNGVIRRYSGIFGYVSDISIRGDSVGKADILGSDSIGHCEGKKFTSMHLMLISYRHTAIFSLEVQTALPR